LDDSATAPITGDIMENAKAIEVIIEESLGLFN